MKLNRKQRNYVISALALVMLVVVAVVLLMQDDTTIEQNYNIKDINSITKIIIDDKDERTLSLEKKTDSSWVVNGRDANIKMIESLLSTFKDMRVREPIAKAARNNIVKQLAASGKKVQVWQKKYLIDFWGIKLFEREKVSKTYFVGSETQDNMGTYMMLKGEEEPCVVYIPSFKGYLSTRFSAVEDIWRSHAVFKYNRDDIAYLKVEIPNQPSESFELVKNGSGFDFNMLESKTKLAKFDTIKVVALLSSLFELNYESVAKNIPQIEKDTVFSKAPAFVFTVKNTKGEQNQLKTYSKLYDPSSIAENESDFYNIFDVNRCYGLHSGNKDTLIFQFFVLDHLLKPASYYFKN